MKDERVYVNESFVTASRASLSIFERGLNYGDGLFETMKAKDGRVLFLKDHLQRMKEGAAALGISTSMLKIKDVEGKIKRLLRANGLLHGDAYVRMTLTRGVQRSGVIPKRNTRPNLIIITAPLDAADIKGKQKRGVRAVILKTPPPAIPGIKTLCHLSSVLGRREAKRKGAFEGLFLNSRGRLTEGTATNLFIVDKGVLKTPPPSEGLLPGITRKKVLEAALRGGIRTAEAPLRKEDLEKAGEAFITNSILEIVPLLSVDGRTISDGTPGKITRRVQGLYAGLISLELVRRGAVVP